MLNLQRWTVNKNLTDVSKDLERQEAEPAAASDPNSLDVSLGSESSRSDVESTEEVKPTPSSEDEVSTASDVLDDEANVSKSPESSDEPAEDKPACADPSPQAQTETESVSVGMCRASHPGVFVTQIYSQTQTVSV
ncbi:protein Niban 1a [Xyrichtys novacula]|uniref:Protein Niban 1a n=1 Tax=Xyrichtys novacula TaxID=13765 RepID=A0AAV1FFJ4_XYRNO|nr:protein Niban 1a [Xyrichtys novacula]